MLVNPHLLDCLHRLTNMALVVLVQPYRHALIALICLSLPILLSNAIPV